MNIILFYFQCRKASDILTQHKILLRNNIPMRVDVLLFPSCEHGLREETVVVGAMFSTVDAFILLERWDIQLINKRYFFGGIHQIQTFSVWTCINTIHIGPVKQNFRA